LKHLLCAWIAALLLSSAWTARAQFFSPGELAQSHATLEGDEH
jgi:hypothetical protein